MWAAYYSARPNELTVVEFERDWGKGRMGWLLEPWCAADGRTRFVIDLPLALVGGQAQKEDPLQAVIDALFPKRFRFVRSYVRLPFVRPPREADERGKMQMN